MSKYMYDKRTKWYNLISGLICQALVAISGLIIPNLILTTYGSVLNGLLATVTQLLAYLSLIESGLYAASLVSMYKPMAMKNYAFASSVLVSTRNFYRKISIWFAVGAFACSFVLPMLIKDDIPLTTILLVLTSLVGVSISNYLFLATYKVALQADDKLYIINIVHIVGIIVQFALSLLVIKFNINIAAVKGVIMASNMFEWLCLAMYMQKRLPEITFDAPPRNDALHQRKDLLVHQILSLVLNNTDVVLLTVFMPSLIYVSVYSIYAMVLLLVQNIVNTVSSMYSSKVGQLYATGNYHQLYGIIKKYEIHFYLALFIAFSSMDILIMPFVSIYTRGISDAMYYVPVIGILFSIYGITRMYRTPFSDLTNSAGRFKETKIQAVNEAGINLVLSIVLVQKYGIVGVLLGSIAGEVYRTIHTFIYCHKKIIQIFWMRSMWFGILNSFIFFALHYLMCDFRVYQPDTYLDFLIISIKVTLIISMLYLIANYVLYCFTSKSYMRKFG